MLYKKNWSYEQRSFGSNWKDYGAINDVTALLVLLEVMINLHGKVVKFVAHAEV